MSIQEEEEKEKGKSNKTRTSMKMTMMAMEEKTYLTFTPNVVELEKRSCSSISNLPSLLKKEIHMKKNLMRSRSEKKRSIKRKGDSQEKARNVLFRNPLSPSRNTL